MEKLARFREGPFTRKKSDFVKIGEQQSPAQKVCAEPMPPSMPYSQLNPAPWKHPSELAMVRDWFYPQHVSRSLFDFDSMFQIDHRQDAIKLVSLWDFRDSKLNHALIATAHLTDALLHDQPGRRDQLSDLALGSIYAMTFCRFVNGLVDRDVRKSVNATIARDGAAAESDAASGLHRGQSSMYAHAQALGLPESFVELRHQATHDEMPSLEVLRVTTQEALEWLWERWWKFNVKGSAEPALSQWLEKHGGQNVENGQILHREEELLSDQQLRCHACHQRKRSVREEDQEAESNSGEEGKQGSNRIYRQKDQKINAEQESQQSVLRQPQPWVIRFVT